jgi:hypothetical protein
MREEPDARKRGALQEWWEMPVKDLKEMPDSLE